MIIIIFYCGIQYPIIYSQSPSGLQGIEQPVQDLIEMSEEAGARDAELDGVRQTIFQKLEPAIEAARKTDEFIKSRNGNMSAADKAKVVQIVEKIHEVFYELSLDKEGLKNELEETYDSTVDLLRTGANKAKEYDKDAVKEQRRYEEAVRAGEASEGRLSLMQTNVELKKVLSQRFADFFQGIQQFSDISEGAKDKINEFLDTISEASNVTKSMLALLHIDAESDRLLNNLEGIMNIEQKTHEINEVLQNLGESLMDLQRQADQVAL